MEYQELVERWEEKQERWEEKQKFRFIRAGTIAAAIYEVNRDHRKRSVPFSYLDIFPFLKPEQSAEDEEAALEAMFSRLGIQKSNGKDDDR